MRPFHRKMLFLEVILLYIITLSAIKESIASHPGSILASLILRDTGEEQVADPYDELPKKVALTFDDGPDPYYTEKLLDGLKARNVRATFFVTGAHAQEYPEIIKRMDEEGHLIGNHTYSHIQLRTSNRNKFKEELKKTSEIISEITGNEVQFVRPPYGTWDKKLEQELNMFPVLWDIDPLDWCRSDASCITRNVVGKVKDNSIILMHDQYKSSVTAALLIVDALKEQRYEFVTVEELVLE